MLISSEVGAGSNYSHKIDKISPPPSLKIEALRYY